MITMIKAVLFDLDNTLIDFMTMKNECCAAAIDAMRSEGLKIEREEAIGILFEMFDVHGIEHPEIFQMFIEKVNGKVDYKMLAEGVVAYRRAQGRYRKPYPDVVPVLEKLRTAGLKLGIVSDAPSQKAWIRLVELGIQDYFDVVVTLGDTGELKPSPLPFRKALDMLKIQSNEILFVGDKPERDIAGAKSVGMKTVFARYGFQTRVGNATKPKPAKGESGADYEIEEFSDLLGLAEPGEVSQREL